LLIEKIKNVQDWLPHDARLVPFYEGLIAFVKMNVPSNEEIEKNKYSTKTIHDPLTGDIYFNSWEMALIDTKLFQRLRKIKQVGLAYLVFPSLNHSRFEHSLGVLGRLNQMLGILIQNTNRMDPKNKVEDKINDYLIQIRIAALMHDIGHCIFSHVSERVIAQLEGNQIYPSAETIVDIFTDHFKSPKKIAIAEILSISIIGTKHTLDFFKALDIPTKAKDDVKKYLKDASSFILGLPVADDPGTIFLAQLISSGLDADKVDYMAREALYAGIKLGIDLDRIYSKLQVFELDSYSLPKNLSPLKKFNKVDTKYLVLGFGKGGQFAFEEFCVARLSLHVKIYLHQKVRAAEAQLTKYLKSIGKSEKFKCIHEWLFLKESFIEIDQKENDLFSINSSIDYTTSPVHKIDDRNLYQRAFGFGHINSLTESISTEENDTLDNLKNIKVLEIFEDAKKNEEEYISLIFDEYKKICAILKEPVNNKLITELIIDIPRPSNIQQGHESLYFLRPPLIPLRWTIPINRIVIYYQLNRALAYVYCPKEHCSLVYLACEKAFYERTKTAYVPEGVISSSILEAIKAIKDLLDKAGYYSESIDLKPVSEYLQSTEAAEKIQTIAENLSQFTSSEGEKANLKKITSFVNQFPTTLNRQSPINDGIGLQEVILCFLEQLKVYDEKILINILKAKIEKIKKTTPVIGVSPLGGIFDSAAHLMYPIRNLTADENVKFGMLDDELILKSDHLIIFDDNINSGLQLLNIMAKWLGEYDNLPENLKLDEEHDVKTLLDNQAILKFKNNIPITFVYSIGFEGVEEKVRNLLYTHLKIEQSNIFVEINTVFKEEEKIFTGANSKFQHERKNDLREFLIDVSTEILKREGKTEDQIANRTLGYANSQAMALFPYNVPTMTITALWCGGEIKGNVWNPLIRRRRRQDNKGHFVGEDT